MPEPYEHVVLNEYVQALEERQSELRRLDEVVLEARKLPTNHRHAVANPRIPE